MAAESIRKLSGWSRLVVGVNADSADAFGLDNIQRELQFAGYSGAEVFSVGNTPHQVASVVALLERASVSGPFTVKDCDNQFQWKTTESNAVAYVDLHSMGSVVAGNKSYVQLQDGYVLRVEEKRIISPHFCCGAYSFADVSGFRPFASDGAEYLSDVIARMMKAGATFRGVEASEYVDWGTADDWRAYRSTFRTLFVDIDGVLVRSSHRSFYPRWGETEVIQENIDYLNALKQEGRTQIILTTGRPEWMREETVKQLEGLDFDRLVMGLQGGARYLINDSVSSRGERTSFAINLERNSPALADEMKVLG
jgi:hypothetical protein